MRLRQCWSVVGCGLVLAAAAAVLGAAPALAQPGGRGVPTLTLYMQQFGSLERRLAEAHAQHHLAALDSLLSPLFELRRADASTLSREAWLQARPAMPQTPGQAAKPAALSHLAVYEVGANAVASFRSRDAAGMQHFIVDVWAPGGPDQWQLRVRFESTAAPATSTPATAPVRPSGRN